MSVVYYGGGGGKPRAAQPRAAGGAVFHIGLSLPSNVHRPFIKSSTQLLSEPFGNYLVNCVGFRHKTQSD